MATPLIVPPMMAPVRSTDEPGVWIGTAVGAADVEDDEDDDDVLELVLVLVVLELDEVLVEVVLVKLLVPVLGLMLVGVARVLGVAVKSTFKLLTGSALVIPVAVASTVVAKSLEVPHPYWK